MHGLSGTAATGAGGGAAARFRKVKRRKCEFEPSRSSSSKPRPSSIASHAGRLAKRELTSAILRSARGFSTRRASDADRAEEERLDTHARAVERARDATVARRETLRNLSPDDLCDELANEIDERWAFLDAMTRAGRGEEHRARVTGEIAQRIRQMKRLDEIIQKNTHLGV